MAIALLAVSDSPAAMRIRHCALQIMAFLGRALPCCSAGVSCWPISVLLISHPARQITGANRSSWINRPRWSPRCFRIYGAGGFFGMRAELRVQKAAVGGERKAVEADLRPVHYL
jgi:hypothetical protein